MKRSSFFVGTALVATSVVLFAAPPGKKGKNRQAAPVAEAPVTPPVKVSAATSGLHTWTTSGGEKLEAKFTHSVQDRSVAAYNDFYESTLRLMKGKDLECFDLKKEPEDLRAKYGRNRFGQGCLLARRLVEGGVRYVDVESGGWDMHKDIQGGMEDRGSEFDTAFAALVSDLDSRGLLDSTMVVVATEFGRKPQFGGSGRGHHPGVFSCVLAGGGAKRGYVHGASDAAGGRVERDPVTVGDLHATVAHASGLPIKKSVTSSSGRPFTVGNKGKPVAGVFA